MTLRKKPSSRLTPEAIACIRWIAFRRSQPSLATQTPHEAKLLHPSLRLRVTVTFLVCSTAVLAVLGFITDRLLIERLTSERDRQIEGGLRRLTLMLPEPAWTLNRQQLHEVLAAELTSNVHLAWVSLHLVGDERPLIVDRSGTTSSTAATANALLTRPLFQPGGTRQIGSIQVASDNHPVEQEISLRRRETLAWIITLNITLALLTWIVMGRLVNRRLVPLVARLAAAPEIEARAVGDELQRVMIGADALLTRLATILDTIGDGVVTINQELIIERCNPAARLLLGSNAKTGIPLNTAFAWHENIRNLHLLIRERVLTRGESLPPKDMYVVNNRQLTIGVSAISGGGAVLVIRDLTEQVVTAERLQQSLRLESIGKLAGGIAHDSNNLLTVIIGASELLSRTVDPLLRRRHSETILSAAHQLADFNRKLLAFARKDPIRREALDLRTVIRETEALLQHSISKQITVVLELPPEPLIVHGDRTTLVNALLNLGVNARDAMPEGGTLQFSVLLTTLQEPQEAAGGGTLTPGDYACILISDSGTGISPEHLDRMFEPFFTTKSIGSGTGLGLAAVLGTVRSHDGTIVVTSSGLRKGTTFRILLPISTDPLAVKKPRESAPDAWHGEGTILVIEDDPVVRMVGQKLLECLGFTVLTAANGRQGLTIYEENKQHIRLILLDMLMPIMGGAECFASLHARNPQLPIIFVSGFSGDIDIEQLITDGAAGWLQKPFQLEDLSTVIRTALLKTPC